MFPIQKVVFLGSKSLGLQALRAVYDLRPESLLAVITLDDSSDARSDLVGFKEFAESTAKPLFIAKNSREAETIIQSLNPDLCLVVCWYWLLKQKLLTSIPHGAVGVHNSLLPKYRGGSPLVWAILNGENEVGFSIFSLTEEMDAGPVWFQEKISLKDNASVGEALDVIQIRLIETFKSGWCDFLDGKVPSKIQDSSMATYCAQRFPDDGQIEWSCTARQVVDFVRAQSNPYPGAFTYLNGQKVTIQHAAIWPFLYFGRPGQVAQVSEEEVLIICGDNKAVRISSVELSGVCKPAKEIFSSIKIRL